MRTAANGNHPDTPEIRRPRVGAHAGALIPSGGVRSAAMQPGAMV